MSRSKSLKKKITELYRFPHNGIKVQYFNENGLVDLNRFMADYLKTNEKFTSQKNIR